jgi:hypothetical protein
MVKMVCLNNAVCNAAAYNFQMVKMVCLNNAVFFLGWVLSVAVILLCFRDAVQYKIPTYRLKSCYNSNPALFDFIFEAYEQGCLKVL